MVPVHFVKDAFGLIAFDGEPLYEYADVENRESQWGTMNFNLWNEEVRSFLMSSACFWCDVYHIDGIRMDAVSNLIYWGGNSNRGVNQGSVDFVKRIFGIKKKKGSLNGTWIQKFPVVKKRMNWISVREGVSISMKKGKQRF